MNKNIVTKGEILTYKKLKCVGSGENGEAFVSLDEVITCQYQKLDMLPYTGQTIYVREGVREKLLEVNKQLKTINSGYELKVVYGYRHPDVQQKYFNEMRRKILKKKIASDDNELDAYVHNFIAVPDVAGHPTGGAIDLTITTLDGDMDMGCDIADFSDQEKMITFSKKISEKAMDNRALLHDLMLSSDFAPFYGEWWHFSYGDKEWAYFYGKDSSFYSKCRYVK